MQPILIMVGVLIAVVIVRTISDRFLRIDRQLLDVGLYDDPRQQRLLADLAREAEIVRSHWPADQLCEICGAAAGVTWGTIDRDSDRYRQINLCRFHFDQMLHDRADLMQRLRTARRGLQDAGDGHGGPHGR
jgi:hypothetical protein